jgi:hypothetical protein
MYVCMQGFWGILLLLLLTASTAAQGPRKACVWPSLAPDSGMETECSAAQRAAECWICWRVCTAFLQASTAVQGQLARGGLGLLCLIFV